MHVVDSVVGAETTVRLIGIDTPEIHKPGIPVQCFGPQATQFATAVLLNQQVTLTPDPTQAAVDRYGRILAYLRINTGPYAGHDYSVLAVEQGYARVYVYRARQPQKIIALREAESGARQERRGLWGACPNALQETVAMLIPTIDRGPR